VPSGAARAEVEHVGVVSRGDENVSRLDVAVDDACGVGGIQRIGDLNSERWQRFHLQAAPGDALLLLARFPDTLWITWPP
jgi:hypothetical protein